jgi:hypothetical protein
MTGSIALLSSDAHALGVLTASGESAELRSRDSIVWLHGGQQSLIETWVVEPGAASFVVLRAFPSAPTEIVPLEPDLVGELRAATHVGPPFHLRVRERLFGPSVMTPLLTPLLGEATVPASDLLPAERASSGREQFVMFTGRPVTSTVTLVRTLPEPLERWLTVSGVVLTHAQRELTARALERDWTVVGTAVARADSTRPVTVGPWLYRFASSEVVVPAAVGSGAQLPEHQVFALDKQPLTPSAQPTRWIEKPWAPRETPDANQPAPFDVTYWGPIDRAATFRLQALLTSTAAPSRVLRGTLVERAASDIAASLVPTVNAVAIPSSGGRGSGLDLLLCVLLGLAPLLYAPESWLLLWAAAVARDQRARGEPVGFAGALWPLYALVVAMFWLVTLAGSARFAALGPMLVGVYRLFAAQESGRARGRVRVDFRRKLKPAEKADPSAKAPAGASKPPATSAKVPAGASKPPATGVPSKAPAGASKPTGVPSKAPGGASKPPPTSVPAKAPAGASKPPAAGGAKAGPSRAPAASSGPSKPPAKAGASAPPKPKA